MERFADDILNGNRRALSKAITLVESTREDHRRQADELLSILSPHARNALRIGITGAPGVGKSTFIQAIGETILAHGQTIAVLAIDPSSARSGGSILGDKTRMDALSQSDNAFIRPTPAGNMLGGVARRSFETMLLCEAAGFEIIMVETVGVGQSETRVSELTDMFLLLLSPGGGDELQGMKRGIMELADLIIVNKADGAHLPLAQQTATDYRNALKLLRPRRAKWRPLVETCSALERTGIVGIWETITRYRDLLGKNGELAAQRSEQMRAWMWSQIIEGLMEALHKDKQMTPIIEQIENEVVAGRLPASTAANQLVGTFLKGK